MAWIEEEGEKVEGEVAEEEVAEGQAFRGIAKKVTASPPLSSWPTPTTTIINGLYPLNCLPSKRYRPRHQ